MSLIIKGMKLPTTGRVDISIDAKGKIYSETPGLAFWEYTAVEIPTPHGRLIDEGTFICRMDDSFRMAGLNGADYRKVKRWLKNARTILEAEERDDQFKR